MHYYASYIRLLRETEVLRRESNSQEKPQAITVSSIFELLEIMKPGDVLWIMIGATNNIAALAAFKRGVKVYQLSRSRFLAWLNNQAKEKEEDRQSRLRVTPTQVAQVAQEKPELFYSVGEAQAEVLEIVSAWHRVLEAIKARASAMNLLISRLCQESIISGRIPGNQFPSAPKEAEEVLKSVLSDLRGIKKAGERGKWIPGAHHIAFLMEQERQARRYLEKVCRNSSFYNYLFGDIKGVGPALGARFVTAIGRIERFARPKDLSNYAGMLPRGKEGHLPSKKRSRGQSLSRSPALNHACFLLQNYLFQWGKNTELGQLLHQRVKRDCLCTPAQRKNNKDLRRRHAMVIKKARIAMTRYFLEKIVWPRWRAYLGPSS